MQWIVHQLLRVAGAQRIYGGFVRDYIVRGERANDIDVEVASMTHLEAVQSALITALTRRQLPVTAVRPKGMAVCVHVNVPGMDEIQVDLVRTNQDQPHPGVDCSAGNLAITCSGDLVVKVFFWNYYYLSLVPLLTLPCLTLVLAGDCAGVSARQVHRALRQQAVRVFLQIHRPDGAEPLAQVHGPRMAMPHGGASELLRCAVAKPTGYLPPASAVGKIL